jgi:fermentation-respiration switch protein FrsA (DUF1100 family)
VQESADRNGPDSPPAKFMPPEHFADGSPLELVPLGVRQIVIHCTDDDGVPYTMSERYVSVAGEEAELVTLEGGGHFELIDPLASEWSRVKAAIESLLEAPGSAAPLR